MISELSLWQWLKLIAAFILFFSPGMLSMIFAKSLRKLSIPVQLSFAFGFSLGFWIMLLIWFQLFNFSVTSWGTRTLFLALFSILSVILFLSRKEIYKWLKNRRNYLELMLIGFGILIIITYLHFYRNLVAGMGSDSMHHTLITSLFIQNGQIPKDYGPYAPVVTFSYHFGYHAYTAAMSLLSGITPRIMVVISGAILMGLVSLSGGALTYYLTKNVLASIVSEAVIGFIYIFPGYSLIWGRYTQLMGTIMLTTYLLALFYWDYEQNFSFKFTPILTLITIGLIYSHYRICIAGIIFTIIYLIVRKNPLITLKNNVAQWIFYPSSALILSSPWLIQLFIARKNGYEAVGTVTKDSFFSLNRLGPLFESETQTWILIGMSVAVVVLSIIKKDRIILTISVWIFVLAIVTQPAVYGYTVDLVTMIVSSYVPISIFNGWFISLILSKGSKIFLTLAARIVIILAMAFGIFSGVNRWNDFDYSKHSYVTPNDLKAANWIKRNIDPESIFMINTYQFPINDNLIIGLDGGYWLPVIAERQTIVPPMIYQVEKLRNPNDIYTSLLFHRLQGKLTNKEGLSLLRDYGVDYVYIGTRRGIVEIDILNDSEFFELIYQQKDVSIYKIVP